MATSHSMARRSPVATGPEKDENAVSGQAPRGAEPQPGSTPPPKPWRTEGVPDESPQKQGPRWWRLLGWVAITYLVVFGVTTAQDQLGGARTISYSEFAEQVEAQNVKEVFARGETIQGRLKADQPLPDDEDANYTVFTTERPTFAQDDLLAELEDGGAIVRATPVVQDRGALWNLVISFAPILLLIGFYVWMYKRQAGGLGGRDARP